MPVKKIIFIVGPTAVGKTDVAFQIARKLTGEIISCDSMQVYKEISIASSKPPEEMLKKIRHHLVDIISVKEEFDVATFNERAIKAVAEIHAREKIPVVVGGSGLYMQILLDGIFPEGPRDVDLRQEIKKRIEKEGTPKLWDELSRRDPQAAEKIHVNDARRIARALEVCLIHQKPISSLQREREGLWGSYDIRIFSLNRDRQELYARINERVDQMFAEGMVREIEALKGKKLSQTAEHIIGIKEVNAFLTGEIDLEQAKELMKMNTRRFAKRQLTWFRKDSRLNWILLKTKDTSEGIADKIIHSLKE